MDERTDGITFARQFGQGTRERSSGNMRCAICEGRVTPLPHYKCEHRFCQVCIRSCSRPRESGWFCPVCAAWEHVHCVLCGHEAIDMVRGRCHHPFCRHCLVSHSSSGLYKWFCPLSSCSKELGFLSPPGPSASEEEHHRYDEVIYWLCSRDENGLPHDYD